MKLSAPPNVRNIERPKPKDRLTFITNECAKKSVIPIGPRFQADVPSWTGPPSHYIEMDNSKWICIPIWPSAKGPSQDTNSNTIGRGRSDICECVFAGSINCVKKHVSDKRTQLRIDLGPAFWKWKFDEMGEDVSRLWSRDEEKRFGRVVKANPTSQGRNFVKCALECFPCQSKASIVSYYLNVHLPRRISVQTRSNCTMIVDSDDDDDDDDDNEDVPSIKGSRKRCQAISLTSGSPTKYVKMKYLMTRR